MKKYLLPISIAALVLTGCSGKTVDPVPTASPEGSISSTPPTVSGDADPITGPGSFTFETTYSGVGTLDVPGEPSAEIERLRVQAGAPEVTYVTGNLDNRQGSEPFSVYSVSVYDPEGNEYVYESASDYLSEIRPSDAPAEIYNQYIELGNSLMDDIDPLQRADFILVGPELPGQITGLSISNGVETFSAAPEK